MSLHVLAVTALVVLSSCQTRQRFQRRQTTLKESPDAASRPEALGIHGSLDFSDVRDRTAGKIDHPWSDGSWAAVDRGLAHRWRVRGGAQAVVTFDPPTLHQQVSEMREAVARKDAVALGLLSPAEKFDILLKGGDVPRNVLDALQTSRARFENRVPATINAKRAELSRLRVAWVTADGNLQQLVQERRARLMEREGALRAGESLKAEDSTKFVENERQAREQERRRDELGRKITALTEEIKAALQPLQDNLIEETRSLKPFLPMTAAGWEQWNLYASNRYPDGKLANHQGGWASASLILPPPEHSVIGKKGDLEVLFTEGDIRALLSKLYAERNAQNDALFSSRCKPNDVNQARRQTIDGIICRGKKSGSCTNQDAGKEIYVKNNRIEDGLVTFSDAAWNDAVKIGVVQSDLGQDYYVMNIFDSSAAFESWFQSGGQAGRYEESLLHFTKGCRDTNPLALHLALTKLIGEGMGFVVDKTHAGLMRRNPAYRYELEYVPIVLNKKDPSGKTSSKGAEPSPIADIADVFRAYRAPRTAFLLQVKAKLFYAKEQEPRDAYDEAAATKDGILAVTYTLELDEDQQLIGGQWGLIPLPGGKVSRDRPDFVTGEGPDLIWYFPRDAALRQASIDGDLIMKLYECSRSGPTTAVKTLVGDAKGPESTRELKARVCNF